MPARNEPLIIQRVVLFRRLFRLILIMPLARYLLCVVMLPFFRSFQNVELFQKPKPLVCFLGKLGCRFVGLFAARFFGPLPQNVGEGNDGKRGQGAVFVSQPGEGGAVYRAAQPEALCAGNSEEIVVIFAGAGLPSASSNSMTASSATPSGGHQFRARTQSGRDGARGRRARPKGSAVASPPYSKHETCDWSDRARGQKVYGLLWRGALLGFVSGQRDFARISVKDPDKPKGSMQRVSGSPSDEWNETLANQALRTLWTAHSRTRGHDCGSTSRCSQCCHGVLSTSNDQGSNVRGLPRESKPSEQAFAHLRGVTGCAQSAPRQGPAEGHVSTVPVPKSP